MHINSMTKIPDRPGLRERVAMRKRGIDPDKPARKTTSQKRLSFWGLALQMGSVFLLLGYILYFTQTEKVQLHVEFLVVVSALFVLGRLMTFFSGNKGFRF